VRADKNRVVATAGSMMPKSTCLIAMFAFVLSSCATGAPAPCESPRTLIDLREDAPKASISVADAERRRIGRDVFDGYTGFSVNSVAHGAFTRAGVDETLYLIQRDGPDATDPAGRQATLAIYAGDRLEQAIGTTLGNVLEATPELGGTGTAALLLRADAYQMGTATANLVLVELAGGRLHERARFDRARVDACADERFGGTVEADVVRWCASPGGTPAFEVDRWRAACVDAKAPATAAFERMPRAAAEATEG
jgi:hypothetical protein